MRQILQPLTAFVNDTLVVCKQAGMERGRAWPVIKEILRQLNLDDAETLVTAKGVTEEVAAGLWP